MEQFIDNHRFEVGKTQCKPDATSCDGSSRKPVMTVDSILLLGTPGWLVSISQGYMANMANMALIISLFWVQEGGFYWIVD